MVMYVAEIYQWFAGESQNTVKIMRRQYGEIFLPSAGEFGVAKFAHFSRM